jgi:hypothetical protein
MCTATLRDAPICAIHSRSAEIAISRPMITSAMKACSRPRWTSTSSAAVTRNLSATGSRKAPNDDVMRSFRASQPSAQSVSAKRMNSAVPTMFCVCGARFR